MTAARRTIVRLLQATGLNRVAHRLYYRHVHGFDTASAGLTDALERCFDRAVDLGTVRDGDYLEFGLFKGYSFWFAQKAAGERGLETVRFFGFDSFAGLPEVEGVDKTSRGDFYKGQYACSRDQVVANLDSRGVDWSRTVLVEGYFERSLSPRLLSQHGVRRAAIALIDCDLYASTAQVLEFLRPIVLDGTILIFDDWSCFDGDDSKGQRRAFKEFLGSAPHLAAEPFFAYGHYGQVFIVRMGASA